MQHEPKGRQFSTPKNLISSNINSVLFWKDINTVHAVMTCLRVEIAQKLGCPKNIF